MSDKWRILEDEQRQQRISPWLFVGAFLIIAVTAVLFASGTWIIRSGQAHKAMDLSESLRVKLDETEANRDKLLKTEEEYRLRIEELEALKASLSQESQTVGGELAAVKRELDATKEALAADRLVDANPQRLPAVELASRILQDNGFSVIVSIDSPSRVQMSQGALIEYLKYRLRRIGVETVDESSNFAVLSVVVAVSETRHTALSVSLSFHERWKVPGEDNSMRVAIWNTHLVGLTSEDRVAAFVEQLVDNAVEDLARQLQ